MFVFIQHFKSNKAPVYTINECSGNAGVAQEYATTLAESSVDVQSVEVYSYLGSVQKVERIEWA